MSIPVIHQTDLFRPYNDPDDHWDLACVYALALAGDFELKGILIDHPPANHRGDPDVLGLAQMNYITGLNVPFSVGSSLATAFSNDRQAMPSNSEEHAVRMMIDLLKNASSPVMITIAGSCRDIAIAARRAPEVFREKCAGIYLNAGTGNRHPVLGAELEYNVRLDPSAFQAVFEIPCPIYWMPCFEEISNQLQVSAFGTWYDFLQADILLHVSDRVQKYFVYALGRIQDPSWLAYLHKEKDHELLAKQAQMRRNMWCTGGFFHAAGKAITSDGMSRPRHQARQDQVFTFDPIEVHCDTNGVMRWSPTRKTTDRYIFHVRDIENYRNAMITAMRSLLTTLP